MTDFTLNGRRVTSKEAGDTPLLWVLRDEFGLTGAKYGCGIAACGACTVHVDGVAIRSCATPVEAIADAVVTTVEGLGGDHKVQKAWIETQVPQCGFCQTGMIMTAAALLKDTPKPTDADFDAALGGHICRCGTYQRIRAAIHAAARA